MAHPEQPNKGNNKPKAQTEKGPEFKDLLKKGADLMALNQLQRAVTGTDVVKQLTDLPKKGAQAFGKLKEMTTAESEKAEKDRKEADKICLGVMLSGLLYSKEFRELKKSIGVNRAGEWYDQAVIKGKDGKQYKVQLKNEVSHNNYDTSSSKTISFLDEKNQLVSITLESYSDKSAESYNFVLKSGRKTLVSESLNFQAPARYDAYADEDGSDKNKIGANRDETIRANKVFSSPKISSVIAFLGGPQVGEYNSN